MVRHVKYSNIIPVEVYQVATSFSVVCGLWSVVVPKVLGSILGVDVCTVWYQSTCYKHNFSLVLVLYNLYTLSRAHQLCKMDACFAGYSPTRGVLERVAVPTLPFAMCCTVLTLYTSRLIINPWFLFCFMVLSLSSSFSLKLIQLLGRDTASHSVHLSVSLYEVITVLN